MDLLRYAIFLIPMAAVFVWVAGRWGVRQALLDLIAFNLMFDFDFGAIIPGGIYFLLLHLLLIMFLAYEGITWIERGFAVKVRVRTLLVLAIAALMTVWLVVAVFVNKAEAWGLARTAWNTTRQYVFSALFIFVGIRLAVDRSLIRFGKIFLVASGLNALVAIVQTASSGRWLTNIDSPYYLGVFQPLGSRFLERRALTEAGLDFTNTIRSIRFGDIVFYRGWGAFDGANSVMVSVAILALCLLLVAGGRKRSLPLIVLFVLASLAMFVALYRTALIAFGLVVGVVLLIRWRQLLTPRFIGRAAALLLVAGLVLLPFIRPISTIVAANLDGFFGSRAVQIGSFNNRDKVWAFALKEIQRSPLVGSGVSLTYLNVGWGPNNNPEIDVGAHNSFIEYAYRGGVLPGLLLLALSGYTILRATRLARDQALPVEERGIFFAVAAALAGLFVTHLVGSQMAIAQVAALFWIPCGYLAAYSPAPVTVAAQQPRADTGASLAAALSPSRQTL